MIEKLNTQIEALNQLLATLDPSSDEYKMYSAQLQTLQTSLDGLKEIQNAQITLENGRKGITKLEKFPYPIYNNCLPHIDVFTENGYTKEEMKMINETRKILKRPDLKITATTVRVPVENSHSESINVEFEKTFELSELVETLKNFEGIVVQDDPAFELYPLATNANGHDEVFVGRIRRDFSVENGVNLWVVADNIRKGAASNAIQIVEKMIMD